MLIFFFYFSNKGIDYIENGKKEYFIDHCRIVFAIEIGNLSYFNKMILSRVKLKRKVLF